MTGKIDARSKSEPNPQITFDPQRPLSTLLEDPLIAIFKKLDPTSAFRVSMTCKYLQSILKHAKCKPVWLAWAHSVGIDIEEDSKKPDQLLFHRIKVVHSIIKKKFPELSSQMIVTTPNLIQGFQLTLGNLISEWPAGHEFDEAIATQNLDVIMAAKQKGFLPTGDSIKAALKTGQSSVIKEVCSYQIKPSKASVSAAIASCNLCIIHDVLALQPDINDCDLNEAIKTGNLDIIRKLLNYGAKPDDNCVSLVTGQMKELLKNGKLDDENVSLFKQKKEILSEILAHEGKPDENSVNDAIDMKDFDLLTLVFSKGGKPNLNSLHKAFATKNREIIKEVLIHKAKPHPEAVNEALDMGDLEILGLVFDNGAVPNDQSVHRALRRTLDFVRKVIAAGGKPTGVTSQNKFGNATYGDMDAIIDRCGDQIKQVRNDDETIRSYIALIKKAFENGGKASWYSIKLALNTKNDELIRIVFAQAATVDNACEVAIQTSNPAYVQIVLENGGIVDQKCLDAALEIKNLEIIEKILATKKVSPNTGHLMTAIKTKEPVLVKTILMHGVTPTKEHLTTAISTLNPLIVETIIRYGVVPDAACLNLALKEYKKSEDDNIASSNLQQIIEMLLEFGAVPRASDVQKTLEVNVDIAKKLVERIAKNGLRYTVQPQDLLSANDAIRAGSSEFLRQVLEYGAELDDMSLFLALRSKDVKIMKIVLEHGAKATLVEDFNEALVTANLEIVRLVFDQWENFKQNGSPIKKTYARVRSHPSHICLTLAAQTGNPEIVRIAINADAKIVDFSTTRIIDFSVVLACNNLEVIKMVTVKVAKDGTDVTPSLIDFNNVEVFQLYLENHDKKDVFEFWDLKHAITKGNREIIKIIAASLAKAQPQELDKFVGFNDPEILQIFFDNGGTCSGVVILSTFRQSDLSVLKKLVVYMAKSEKNWLDTLIDLKNPELLQDYIDNGGVKVLNPDTLRKAVETKNVNIVKIICSLEPPKIKDFLLALEYFYRERTSEEVIAEIVASLARSGTDYLEYFIQLGNATWLRIFVANSEPKPQFTKVSLLKANMTKNPDIIQIVKALVLREE